MQIRVSEENNRFGALLRPAAGENVYVAQGRAAPTTLSPPGLVGLSNLGNTCYMNSALQCLLNTPGLTNFFLTSPAVVENLRGKSNGSKAYRKLVCDTWASSTGSRPYSYTEPRLILHAIRIAYPMFRGFHQHDSQEFLRCFMEQLHEELMEPIVVDEEEEKDEKPLDAVSEDVSPVNSEESDDGQDAEEYETADSGVSEQSDTSPKQNSRKQRKRKLSSAQGSNNVSSSQEDLTSGVGSSSSPLLGSSKLTRDADVVSSADEFSDAASGTSSPRYNGLVSARSPSKSGAPPLIRKRKPKTYRYVILNDNQLNNHWDCLLGQSFLIYSTENLSRQSSV